MLSTSRARRYTLILIIATGIVRVIIAAFTGLGVGESYYARGAIDVDWSYFDQPPLFFWISAIFVKVFGLSSLTLRLPAILFFGGTTWLIYRITEKLFSSQGGFYAAVLLNLSAVFTVAVGTWFQPDAPLMFFWMLTAYLVVNILFGSEGKKGILPWVYVGLAMGMTTLSKYHVVFLMAGVFLFCVLTPKYRKWLRHPGPYLAVVINFMLAFPVLIWNAQNEWVSFVFQGSRAGSGGEFELHWLWFFRSILGQMIWLLPWIWIPLVRQLPLSYQRNDAYRFIFWTSVLPIVFFTVITLWSNLGFHFHWQAPGYLMLFIALGASVAESMEKGKWIKLNWVWLWSSAVFTVVALTVLAIQTETGAFKFVKREVVKRGGTTGPTMEGYDYDDLRVYFEKQGWMEDEKVFLGTPNWWLTGKLDWALRLQKDVIVFHDDPRNYAFFMEPEKKLGQDGIIVLREGEGMKKTKAELIDPYFEEVVFQDSVAIMRGGEAELYLYVYRGEGFRIPEEPVRGPLYRMVQGMSPFGLE